MPRHTKGLEPEIDDPDFVRKMAVNIATDQLARYGEVCRQIEEEENRLNDAVAKLQAESLERIEPWKSSRSDLESAMKIFANSWRENLAEGKTISLPTGTISFKAGNASIDITDEKAALRSIRRLGKGWMKLLIQIKFSIRKSELLKSPDTARKLDGLEYVEPVERIYFRPQELEVDTPATGKPATRNNS